MNYDVRTVGNSPPLYDLDGEKIHLLNSGKSDRNHLRSLVVDDDHTILDIVAHMLTLIGFKNVQTAQKRFEVMERLSQRHCDLLVTDLEMPDMNGFQLTKMIKHEMQDTKVIIMTGRHDDDCLEMMATRWVDGWLFKPFGWKDLRAMIQRLGLLKNNCSYLHESRIGN
jgi:two-component system, chemotaxis family, chemotaxis protein CheY